MARLYAGFPALDPGTVSLYYTKDLLLENLPILVFYGASTTRNATRSSARVQAHVYSLAGLRSFPSLVIAPSSPLYAAVNHLPSDKQGDEIFRGLAVSLLSYFSGLSGPLKDILKDLAARRRPNRVAPAMFDEMHAGDLASRMIQIEDASTIIKQLSIALPQQQSSWVDVDIRLPPDTIHRMVAQDGSESIPASGEDGLPIFHYGHWSSCIEQIGQPAFLPTSKLRRAPSRPRAHSKSKSLSKDQKIALRREMCEMLDTEKSYVAKLQSLLGEVAEEFRCSHHADIQRRGLGFGEDRVNLLFPESLSQIRVVNEEFLAELEDVLSATEDEAIQDIEGLAESLAKLQLDQMNTASRRRDPTGALAFAKILLKWLPNFSGPYQEYMRGSANLPKALNALSADGTSNLSQTLNQFGEQRLRSLLIEPVQRLPRYSLLVDSMISQLPASHPALSSLSRSKDAIADICALDNASLADSTRTSNALRKSIRNWPSWLSPRGRLIAAVDVKELEAPYGDLALGSEAMLLLFPDTLIIVQKEGPNALSAKAVLIETDHPSMTLTQETMNDKGLSFSAGFDLSKLHVSESTDGRIVRLIHTKTVATGSQVSLDSHNLADVQVKIVSLYTPYEGKAHRLSEEIAKAKIEGRFSEPIRESDRWALRRVEPDHRKIGVIAAIYERGESVKNNGAQTHCRVQIDIGDRLDEKEMLPSNMRTDLTIEVRSSGPDAFTLIAGGFCIKADLGGLSSSLVRMITERLEVQATARHSSAALLEVACNREILHAQAFRRPTSVSDNQSSRPISPLKLVSNLFGGSTGHGDTPSKWRLPAPKIKEMPPIPPPKTIGLTVEDQSNQSPDTKASSIEAGANAVPDPLAGLELTFNAYVIALRSRSGNIVGRILRNRAAADELEVNELYNVLVENPARVQAAAEVSIDVLFAAFEKFMAKGWQERMGILLAEDTLVTMTSALDLGKPVEFAQQVHKCLEDMSPQSRRAFTAAIKLLSDLLDAAGNDGDRGALMASFTEALVSGSNPHGYIILFDRLVEDYDNLFEASAVNSTDASPGTGTTSDSLKRHRSVNTGSMSSNASSLKKRFGFGNLSRENSKSESESKVASVWRALNKNAKSPSENQLQPGSLSKGSLLRSKSTDTNPWMLPPPRPVSRDLPTPPSASPRDASSSRATSSHMNMSILNTIGEDTPTKVPVTLKKKRRSSLSDLKPIQDSASGHAWLPLQPRKLPQPGTSAGAPPRTPTGGPQSFRNTPSVDYSQRFGSPERFGSQRQKSPQRTGSPHQKENSPSQRPYPKKTSSPAIPRYQHRKPPTSTDPSEVTIQNLSPKKRIPSSNGASATRVGLTERAWPPNAPASISPTKQTPSSPQKLRMQNPQKLRERLSNEQRTLSGAEASLQAEIAKIGEEMSVFRLSRPDANKRPSPEPSNAAFNTAMRSFESRLASLSASLTTLTTDLRSSNASLSKDVESSLLVSERKARKLDELYKEANAENEALYDRFNDELGKVLKGVKAGAGEGVEELRRKVKEGEEESGRLRRENARLRREVLGLRSQLKES
ncbi:MAG: hypothetical protein LQ350_000167 [Teloschistes chrysophthalmus]|nr:MAG: hypothetical protein LQ350_000167 [Niorma chrysophthalma]